VLRIGKEAVQSLSERLTCKSLGMSRRLKRNDMAHDRSCVDGGKVDRKDPPRHAIKRLFYPFGLAHEPHEHVILYTRLLARQ
jgi:hypothetical protein